ncbi:MAG TPA: VOC family protein [Solirubrobacteraceae bacterium]|jgi:catechol 2,3-dioxygenase-like lactoylglutathione lyase family enzyme
MEHDEIQALLAGIQPSDTIPTPPGFRAIPVAPALDAGGDPAELEAWAKAQGGWARRMPAHFMPPDATERDLVFYIVPEKALEGGPPPVPATLPASDLIAFMPTTDLVRARVFYEQGLGLPIAGESPIACTFDANGTTLRVIAVETISPAPYTALGWNVADIEASIRELTGRGVVFEDFEGVEQDELGVWRSPGGARVAWFKDPDGNTLSLTQF